MSRHTPAPWDLQRHRIYEHDTTRVIAEVSVSWRDSDTAAANARLIAAAPDTANACCEAHDFLIRHYEAIYGRGHNIPMAAGATLLERVLRAAIAKAEGKK